MNSKPLKMTNKDSSMADCTSMLDWKICKFTSFEDISYFLGTTDANVAQKISQDFPHRFGQLLQKAMKDGSLDHTVILIQVLRHLVRQNEPQSLTTLTSSGFHTLFVPMIRFILTLTSTKKNGNIQADQAFVSLIKIVIDYSKKMGDHCGWLFENVLDVVLKIVAEPTATYFIRIQAVENFLSIFDEDDPEVVQYGRKCIEKNDALFDQLSEEAIGSLFWTGDFQLQEVIVELLCRIWPTDARRRKAIRWLANRKNILPKFLAIAYDSFDYGVRMFLNEVNCSSDKRRILTLPYKELRVGSQILYPTNQWSNCVDFCYESKVLDVRFPNEEQAVEHRCDWNLNSIKSSYLLSFRTTEDSEARTVDLHLKFQGYSRNVLNDFALEDETAKNLIIKFYRATPLDAQKLSKFAQTLFGSKYLEAKKNTYSQAKGAFIGGYGSTGYVSERSGADNAANMSFIQLTQGGSQTNSQDALHHVKSSSCSQTASQISMMRNLAMHGVKERNSNVETLRSTSECITTKFDKAIGSINRQFPSESGSCASKRYPATMSHMSSIAENMSQPLEPSISFNHRSSQLTSRNDPIHVRAEIHNPTEEFLKHTSSQVHKPDTGDIRGEIVNSQRNYGKPRNSITRKPVPVESRRLPVRHKASEGIKSYSSDEFASQKPKSQRTRKTDASKRKSSSVTRSKTDNDSSDAFRSSGKQVPLREICKESGDCSWNDIVPETQVGMNTSTNSGANISADLMLQCLHGSGADPSEFVIAEEFGKAGRERQQPSAKLSKRITRSQAERERKQTKNCVAEDVLDESCTQLLIDNEVKSTETGLPKRSKAASSSKVNAEFEILKQQFGEERSQVFDFDQDETDNTKKATEKKQKRKSSLLNKKKKRSLGNTDTWQQFDEVDSEKSDDPVTRSIKAKPFAAKFIKTPVSDRRRSAKQSAKKEKETITVEIFKTDTEGQKSSDNSNEPHRKPKTRHDSRSTRSTSKNLSAVTSSESEKGKTQEPFEIVKTKKTGRKKKKELPLPFEDLEEIPTIVDCVDDITSPIEAVRDAPVELEERIRFSSPDFTVKLKKKSKQLPQYSTDTCCQSSEKNERSPIMKKIRARLLEETDSCDLSSESKRKKPRVSFDPTAKPEDSSTTEAEGQRKHKKRKKGANLFDSTSDAASAASSELSWIKEYKASKTRPPKVIKTFKRKKQKRKKNKSLAEITGEELWNPLSTSSSGDVDKSDLSPMSNKSLASGISRLQSLGCSTNLTFDEIAHDQNLDGFNFDLADFEKSAEVSKIDTDDQIDCASISLTDGDNAPGESLAEACKIGMEDWNKATQGDVGFSSDQDLSHKADVGVPDDQGQSHKDDDGFSSDQDLSHKKIEDPVEQVPAAKTNNSTPSDMTDRLKLLERRKPESDRESPLPSKEGKYLKSKKKLQLMSYEPEEACSSLNPSSPPHCSDSSKVMIKLVGKYIKQINNNWKEGHSERAECLDSFEHKVSKCEKRHEKLLQGLKVLETEAVDFVNNFNSKVDFVMKKAAENVVSAKLMQSDLTRRLNRNNDNQNEKMNKLRRQISKELKEMVRRVEADDVQSGGTL